MEVQAIAKGVRISPRKAGLVAALVRGRTVADALVILEHTPKKAAPIIKKVVESAKANAVTNHNLKEDSLNITRLTIGQGIAMKRYRPVARGSAHPYKHRTSHIKVVVSGKAAVTKTKSAKSANAKSKAPTVKTAKKG